MPKVADLSNGARICRYHRDHDPPHFHVEHAGQEVLIRIADLGVMRGSIHASILQDAQKWAANHQAELAFELGPGSHPERPEGYTVPMSQAIIHRIEKIEAKPGYKLLVTWTTGRRTPVDFVDEG